MLSETIDHTAEPEVKPDTGRDEVVLEPDVVEETLAYDIMLKR